MWNTVDKKNYKLVARVKNDKLEIIEKRRRIIPNKLQRLFKELSN